MVTIRHLTLIASLFLSACFSAKSEVSNLDPDCHLSSKSWELEFQRDVPGLQIASQACNSAECLLSLLVSGSAVTATSFIVSGSIVVVGNTIHWLEKQGTCKKGVVHGSVETAKDVASLVGGTVIYTKDQFLSLFSDEQDATPIRE